MWLFLLSGVAVMVFSLYGAFASWRRLHGIRRIAGTLGGMLLATGVMAWHAALWSAYGYISPSFEWPVGRADQIIELPDGRQVVSHTSSARIQMYDQAWRFLHAWHVDAIGGDFKARLTPDGLLEVWTARGQKRYVFDLDGQCVSEGRYKGGDYATFQMGGAPGYVPTLLPLWVFAHPVVAWFVCAIGGAMLMLSNPRGFWSRETSQADE